MAAAGLSELGETTPTADYTLSDEGMEVLAVTADGIATLLVPIIAMADEAHERARAAEHLNSRLTAALARCVDNYPVTSWGPTNDALDSAKALLAELEQAGTMEPTTTPEETR